MSYHSPRYKSIDWNCCDPELYDLLEERCIAKLANCSDIDWDDLTRLAQDRIEQQCMAEIEASCRDSFDEAQIDAVYG